jgi:hypothetical protein
VSLQPRPTAAELLEAVREFLERDVVGVDNPSARVGFHARVAANVLAIVERELTLGPELDAADRERLHDLLGRDGPLAELHAELAGAIRAGTLDAHRAQVVGAVRESVRAKLLVTNPRYLDA